VRSLTLILAVSTTLSRAAEPLAEQSEFFENKIRPLFAQNCYACHSAKAEKVKGGLRLDTPEALLKGGSSGPAIVPGSPESSLLIKAVRYTDPDLRMPPKDKKLAGEDILNLEAWVKMGAPIPHASIRPELAGQINEARARHWAFHPPVKPKLPAVRQPSWIKTPVDNFVLSELDKRHLKPAPPADLRTLIRRVTYDLTGLPPTWEEVEAFCKDNRTDAYARLVERLLRSPHYGERWGRYWLDVARYADTKGYLPGGEQRRYPFSFTYRDYVIRAFNEDKPYDQFLLEQIAADQLPLGEDKSALAALGFLTLGRRFLNNENDIIDDRIDVVTRGTLGLTVACARCHDHKFDPIPTKDYYALHGVFASSTEPGELPLLGPVRASPEYDDYLKQKAKIEAEIPEFKKREIAKFHSELCQHVGDYLLGAHDAPRTEDVSKFELYAGERKLNPAVLRRWISQLDAHTLKPEPVFAPWMGLVSLTNLCTGAKALLAGVTNDPTKANRTLVEALAERGCASLAEAAEVYNQLFKAVDAEWREALSAAAKAHQPTPATLPNPEREELRQALYGEGVPVNLPTAEAEAILNRQITEGTAPLRNKIAELGWTHPGAPRRAMALVDRATSANSHVLIRGNPASPGEEVPRRFLQILSGPSSLPFTNGSGRLELARAIASPSNPLTARVYVNRVWLHHFGEGIVNTPGDFGVRTEEPAQRPLLDFLAASFVESGWSTKALHRLILLSSSYQQSSMGRPPGLKTDPDNRLLGRMNRQRLDFEALRDTLLAISGKLEPSMGGPPVDIEREPFPTRRTIYALIDRQNLPSLFRTFDFANPDTSNQGRFRTTVPQQALFLMNSPFVIEQARSLAQRPEIKGAWVPAEQLAALYHLALQRPPAHWELRLGEQFIARQPLIGTGLSPVEKYAQILLLSNELAFVD
jgi:mono/diheme cytochrome c family protein